MIFIRFWLYWFMEVPSPPFLVTEVSSSTFGWHVPLIISPIKSNILSSLFFFIIIIYLFLSSLYLINFWLPQSKGILIIAPTLTQMHLTTVINVIFMFLLLFYHTICLACNFRFIHINCLPFSHYCSCPLLFLFTFAFMLML